ncbi:MAG: OstA-like protein [Bacteroidia bacterium]|nr:OstA-like protein [Bacteroidia bacterium]
MPRPLTLLLILSLAGALRAQQPFPLQDSAAQSRRLKILNAAYLTFEQRGGLSVQKLVGQVRLRQDSTLFYCDSALFYDAENRVEAFGRVRADMPDNVTLTAARMTYDANTRIAEVFNNIRLTDGEVVLTTQRMTYFRNEDYGYYQGGGKLVDDSTTLTSVYGYYYPNEQKAYFKRRVELVNPDYTLKTDTLGYNVKTKVAQFVTYTVINSRDGEIVTRSGEYDTEARRVNLFQRATVRDSSYTLTADTLRYTDNASTGIARGRVVVVQKDSSLEVRGNYGRFSRELDESLLAENPVAIQRFDGDSLFIFADTLFSTHLERPVQRIRADTVSRPETPDGQWVVRQDTLQDTVRVRVFKAYRNVRFFMRDFQGIADSMVYFFDDSLICLFGTPVLWSETQQLSGDLLSIWMRRKQIDSLYVGGNGFLVAQEGEAGFNQIKGKELKAKFMDNKIHRLEVEGNSESIFFIRDDQDTARISYQGMNQASSQEMLIYFRDNEARKVVFKSKPQGTFFPYFEVAGKDNRLEGMEWRADERPERPVLAPAPPEAPLTEAPAPAGPRTLKGNAPQP